MRQQQQQWLQQVFMQAQLPQQSFQQQQWLQPQLQLQSQLQSGQPQTQQPQPTPLQQPPPSLCELQLQHEQVEQSDQMPAQPETVQEREDPSKKDSTAAKARRR